GVGLKFVGAAAAARHTAARGTGVHTELHAEALGGGDIGVLHRLDVNLAIRALQARRLGRRDVGALQGHVALGLERHVLGVDAACRARRSFGGGARFAVAAAHAAFFAADVGRHAGVGRLFLGVVVGRVARGLEV